MSQWYLSYDGRQIGPLDQTRAVAQARENPNGYAWREGFTDWLPLSKIAELSASRPQAPAPPPQRGGSGRADEIDSAKF